MARWNKRINKNVAAAKDGKRILEERERAQKKVLDAVKVYIYAVVWLYSVYSFATHKDIKKIALYAYFCAYFVVGVGIYLRAVSVITVGRLLMGLIMGFILVTEHEIKDLYSLLYNLAVLIIYGMVHNGLVDYIMIVCGMELKRR